MAQQRALHAHFFWPKACEKPLPIAVCLHASFNNVAKAAAVVVVVACCLLLLLLLPSESHSYFVEFYLIALAIAICNCGCCGQGRPSPPAKPDSNRPFLFSRLLESCSWGICIDKSRAFVFAYPLLMERMGIIGLNQPVGGEAICITYILAPSV